MIEVELEGAPASQLPLAQDERMQRAQPPDDVVLDHDGPALAWMKERLSLVPGIDAPVEAQRHMLNE